MRTLREHRNSLRISQSRLARLAKVSRPRICLYELGDGKFTHEEMERIRAALRVEAERLRTIALQIDFGELELEGQRDWR